MWALNKNPVDRPANADQFITALEQAKTALLSGDARAATASMPALAGVAAGRYAAAAALVRPADAPPPDQAGTPTGRRRYRPARGRSRRVDALWPWLVALLCLLLAGGGVAAYLLTAPGQAGRPASWSASRSRPPRPSFRTTASGDQLQVTNARAGRNRDRPEPARRRPRPSRAPPSRSPCPPGPGNTTVPTVVGRRSSRRKSSIQIADLKVGKVVHESSSQYDKGQVIDTSPAAGATAAGRHAGDALRLERPAVGARCPT